VSLPQVHEEILRLLLAAAPRLEAAQLGRHLQSALQNSRKSRRCGRATHCSSLCGHDSDS